MIRHKLCGVGAAMITPFTPEGKVDYQALARMIDYVIEGGVDYIVALGTTAETPTLYMPERAVIAMFITNHIAGRVPLVMGCGGNSTSEVLDQLREFDLRGADAILSVTPYYNKPSQEGLYQHFRTIANAVELPIILYNIPARTGNKLLPETVQALCRDVDVIVGAKDSSGDIENLKAYIRLTRELDKDVAILAGNDGAILTCLKEGGAGGIAGRANIWPATVAKIYDCFKAGDLEGAQAAQDAIAILQQTFKYGNPNTIIKTAVALQGHNVGKCRAPFNYVPEEGLEAIKKVLAENAAKGLN